MYTNKQIWNVCYPIFLGLLAQNIINVTDTAFLGRVGEVELGASALGGLFYICAFTIAYGFSTGSQIVIARRNGERSYDQVGPVMIQGVFFLFVLAALLFTFSQAFSHKIMSFLLTSETILDATSEFLSWRVFGFFFSFMSVMFRAFYIGITRTKVLTINAIFMAITNVVLDYLLIFGHAGFPAMGLKGAAIASVIAEAVSILFLFIYTRLTVDLHKYGLDKLKRFDFALLKRVLGISVFMMMQYFISMATFLLFFVFVERLGQRELAVANIVRSIYIILFIPVNSLGTTTNSLVSNLIGAGKTDHVIPIIKKIATISFFVMLAFVSVICLMPELIVSVYTNDVTLIQSSIPSVYVICGAMSICAVGNIVFMGVSGTGNTRSAFAIEFVALIFYCIYLYVIVFSLRLPVHICFTSEFVYFASLAILCVLYFKRGNWKNRKI